MLEEFGTEVDYTIVKCRMCKRHLERRNARFVTFKIDGEVKSKHPYCRTCYDKLGFTEIRSKISPDGGTVYAPYIPKIKGL